jgi:hypothetical protein
MEMPILRSLMLKSAMVLAIVTGPAIPQGRADSLLPLGPKAGDQDLSPFYRKPAQRIPFND